MKSTVFELLREAGITVIFGNPGSNELPFIDGLPPPFRYITTLHEGVAVGMADGFAQASGRPGLLSLHAAAGTGNGIGALTNASTSRTPLIVVAGQQARAMIPTEAMLTIPEPNLVTAPFTRWSYQPARPQDVPAAFARAIHRCQLPTAGPVFLSIPLDDWNHDDDPVAARSLPGRSVEVGGHPSAQTVSRLAGRLSAAESPALVIGGESDTDVGFASAIKVAEAWSLPTFAAAETYRFGFPSAHPLFRGSLPIGRADVAQALSGYDFVLVVGAQTFRYHQYQAGDFLSPNTHVMSVTHDVDQAAYTQVGDTVLADPSLTLSDLAAIAPAPTCSYPSARPAVTVTEFSELSVSAPFDPLHVFRVINATQTPGTAYVVEAPSVGALTLECIHTTAPRSFYAPAAGGLGFGLPAAVGVAIAQPNRPVTAVIGDGSAQYGITALWTAARERVPLVICYLRNGTYEALRQFATVLGTDDVPGLDLPGIDIVSIAKGYGVEAHTIGDSAQLETALRRARDADGPVLLDIPTTVTTS